MKNFKVSIKNLSGQETNAAEFDTHEEAQAWIDSQKAGEHPWGYVKEGVYTIKPSCPHTEKIEINPLGFDVTTYVVDKQYTGDDTIIDQAAEASKELEINRIVELGKRDRQCCEEVLSYIGGCNRDKVLTKTQIDYMLTTFATIDVLLSKGRPTSAKALIANITVDGVIVTQDMKDGVAKIFSNYGI